MEREPISLLISEDEPTDRFSVRKVLSTLESSRFNFSLAFEPLVDFFLKAKFYPDPERRFIPEVILATYAQPFTDLKFVLQIRQVEALTDVPIYIFVNEDITHTREKFLQYGVTAVFQNPSPQAVEQIIRKLLQEADTKRKELLPK